MSVESPLDGEAVTLTSADWRALRDHLGDALDELRDEEPLESLDASFWSIFVLILLGWTWGEDRPTQKELTVRSRVSIRTVRRCLLRLEELGVVTVREDRGLRVGPRLGPLLKRFAASREPSVWIRAPLARSGKGRAAVNESHGAVLDLDEGANGSHSSMATAASRTYVAVPEADDAANQTHSRSTPARGACGEVDPSAGGPTPFGALMPTIPAVNRVFETSRGAPYRREVPDDVVSARGLIKRSKKEEDLPSYGKGDPAVPDRPSGPTSDAPPSGNLVDAPTSRRLALQALAELHRLAHPGIPLPRAAEASDVRLVEACAARSTWDASTLEQAHRDAIAGALVRSTSGAPTPMFIWGQFHFFLKNAGIGRTIRLKAKPVARPKSTAPGEPMATPEWVTEHFRSATAKLDRISDDRRPTAPPRFRVDAE